MNSFTMTATGHCSNVEWQKCHIYKNTTADEKHMNTYSHAHTHTHTHTHTQTRGEMHLCPRGRTHGPAQPPRLQHRSDRPDGHRINRHLHTHTHICIYIQYIYTYIYTCIHTYIYRYTHTHICIYIQYTYTYKHIHIYCIYRHK